MKILYWLLSISICIGIATTTDFSQSIDQNFPTPVKSSEIAGEIRARDIGDSRLTRYFYEFEGTQGDIFINIVTQNFSGDIDLFIQNGLVPLTKIVAFADANESETGRVIYLRKPEKLLLRVQGRSPNDEPAKFQLKFAGSFVASSADISAIPPIPEVATGKDSEGRVNSVGTLIEKAKPMPKVESKVEAKVAEVENRPVAVKPTAVKPSNPKKTKAAENVAQNTKSTEEKPKREAKPPNNVKTIVTKEVETKIEPKVEPIDPLANVKLVILFKDGKRIEKPLNDVFRFSVDKGVLTVIAKDGRVRRFEMIDVSKVTIE